MEKNAEKRAAFTVSQGELRRHGLRLRFVKSTNKTVFILTNAWKHAVFLRFYEFSAPYFRKVSEQMSDQVKKWKKTQKFLYTVVLSIYFVFYNCYNLCVIFYNLRKSSSAHAEKNKVTPKGD